MTNPADRDAAVDRLLKAARPDPPAAAEDGCLDADVLAAWADGMLPAAERAGAERHAADCGRCQALLAAMVRTEPPASVGVPRWSPWSLFRWAVPLSAAAAVALWFAVDREVPSRVSERAAPAPATAVAPSPGAEQFKEAAKASAPGNSAQADLEPKDLRRRADASDVSARKDAPLASTAQVPGRSATQTQEQIAAAAETPAPAAPAPGGAPVPPSAASTSASAPTAQNTPPPPAPQAAAESATTFPFLGETAAQTQAARRTAAADSVTTGVAESAIQKRAQPGQWTEVRSPDPLIRWRFSPRSDVERSNDGGLSWTREGVGPATMLVAGSAPSSSVCWLVGRAGAVLRFTTTRGWQRVAVPGSPDLVAIDAKDADNATVTLANSRQLTTTDGGVSWQ